MEISQVFATIPAIEWVLWLIVVDYVLGFVAAIVKKEFRLGKVAKVMGGPVLKYLLGLAVLSVISQSLPAFSWIVVLGVVIVVLAMVGSILENISKFGILIPNWLKRE